MIEQCLEIKNVSKHFLNSNFKLNKVSFSLPKGYIMGLVGPNGAGKTTTIRLILNMLEKDDGKISVFGKDNIQSEKEIKQDLGIVFDSSFYVDTWTAQDTEKALSIFYQNWRHDTFCELVERFGLPVNRKINELSRGMQMKLMLACAFSHNAKLLILDEPTSGLDPIIRDEFLEILQDYIKDGERSVLFSTHIITDLERVADFITIINNGEIEYTGSRENLIGRYRLIRGNPQDLTMNLEKSIIGLRKTDINFEGLVLTDRIPQIKNVVFDEPTIDDIVIYIGKGGTNK